MQLGLLSTANRRQTERQADDGEARHLEQLLRQACHAGVDLSGLQRALDDLERVVFNYDTTSPPTHQEAEARVQGYSLKNVFSSMTPIERGYVVSLCSVTVGSLASIGTGDIFYFITSGLPMVVAVFTAAYANELTLQSNQTRQENHHNL
ncbi:hypothetical protein HYS47_02645 [Candidatus Woesearchaeota archaeon]|nr:hypothetical protein [Candidatus Woesearchaeota archaeon]